MSRDLRNNVRESHERQKLYLNIRRLLKCFLRKGAGLSLSFDGKYIVFDNGMERIADNSPKCCND